MARLRRGQIVAVTFLDHCQGGRDPLQFVVYGRLAAITATCVTIIGWQYAEKSKSLAIDQNSTSWNIVRSAISKITRLVEAK